MQTTVFFKPAGAWIHFAIDYLRALNTENYEDLFYATIKEKDVDELEKGRFWIFSYEMEFDGFFIDKDGYALGIRDELADVIKVDAFKKQMKDIIEYRTMEYYRRRYVEK